LLFRYGPDRRPLELPTRPNGHLAPALLGTLDGTGHWDRRESTVQVPPGVALVRLYPQCFTVSGMASSDDISVTARWRWFAGA
jgi:hypothetical protein